LFTLLTDLKIAGIEVKFIRCDDSGENKAFYDACWSKGYLIKFEFSGPRTPQRNGKAERKFQTLYGRIRAMLIGAGLDSELRSGVWSECANNATFLSNITCVKGQAKCPYQLLFNANPKLPSSLRIFGEMGVVTIKADIQAKLANCGTTCMFMGYSVDHSNDVFRMLNLSTKRIINSRDVIWLNRNYKNWSKTDSQHSEDNINDDFDNLFSVPKARVQINEDNQQELDERVKNKLYRQLKTLESSLIQKLRR